MNCSLCGGNITAENQRTAFRQVIGWCEPRKTKLHERKETGAFAHRDCILRLKLGFKIEQQALFE